MKLSDCTKSWNSNVLDSLLLASFQPDSLGMIARSSLEVRILGFSMARSRSHQRRIGFALEMAIARQRLHERRPDFAVDGIEGEQARIGFAGRQPLGNLGFRQHVAAGADREQRLAVPVLLADEGAGERVGT